MDMFGLKFDKRGIYLFLLIFSYGLLSRIVSSFVDSLVYNIISLILSILLTFCAVFLFSSFYDQGKGFEQEEIKNLSYTVVLLNSFVMVIGIFLLLGSLISSLTGLLALSILPIMLFFILFIQFYVFRFAFFLYSKMIQPHPNKIIITIVMVSTILVILLISTIVFGISSPSEKNVKLDQERCNDGLDNDGDGNIDCSDTDCSDKCIVEDNKPTCCLFHSERISKFKPNFETETMCKGAGRFPVLNISVCQALNEKFNYTFVQD